MFFLCMRACAAIKEKRNVVHNFIWNISTQYDFHSPMLMMMSAEKSFLHHILSDNILMFFCQQEDLLKLGCFEYSNKYWQRVG